MPLWGTPRDEQISSYCVSQALFRPLFPHCMSTGCLPCLLSKSSSNVLQALPELSTLTFKTPGFKPHWLQGLTKIRPSHLPSQLLWGFVFPVHSPVCESLILLYKYSSLPIVVATFCFSPKPHLHTSFFNVTSYLLLVI